MIGLCVPTAVLLIATACASVPPQADVEQVSGRLTLLRLDAAGMEYGQPDDGQGDDEVVIQLDSEPGKAFGFQLRPDGTHLAVRQGMLDLLRDAFNNSWIVTIDYIIEAGRKNGVIVHVGLTRTGQAPDGSLVTEVPKLPITAEDPILQGARLDPSVILDQLPDPPPELSEEGAHELMSETDWTFVEETQLGPNQTEQKTVSFDEPVLLQARATWFGALVPVEMVVTMHGTTLATGKAYPSPPNRGTITLHAQISSPGSATVSLINKGSIPVGVEMIIGVVPLSLVQ